MKTRLVQMREFLYVLQTNALPQTMNIQILKMRVTGEEMNDPLSPKRKQKRMRVQPIMVQERTRRTPLSLLQRRKSLVLRLDKMKPKWNLEAELNFKFNIFSIFYSVN